MRVRLVPAALSAVALAGTLSLPAAASAHAPAKPSSHCPEGYVCFWTGPHYSGTIHVYDPVSYYCDTVPAAPARTVFNNDDKTWSFYADQDCGAHVRTLAPGGVLHDTEIFSWKK